ncbi:uncharacterized protein [Rutidosis leptorrhynchoides]|uniref:uncharacterized protein n=1 Tax=Rutidosis leptorrhynchoides TaxID=125765 RepID=UPI003A98F2F2
MAWVKWSQILLPYDFGGLNVCSLKLKNYSLLAKWWWRFLTNENAFWVRVIKSIYGHSSGLGCVASLPENKLKKLSGRTWSNIIILDQTLTKLGFNLSNAFVKYVGKGLDTSFWSDVWLGDSPLKVTYPRLYRLELNKDAAVANRISFDAGAAVFSWSWSTQPRWRTNDELVKLT